MKTIILRIRADPTSAIFPANLAKTCEKEGCHSKQNAIIYGGECT